MERNEGASPDSRARVAGVFYLLTFLSGGFALVDRSRLGVAAGQIAGACYVAVTWLFYGMFKPVSKSLSLLALFVSLAGIAAGPLGGGASIPSSSSDATAC